MTYEFVESSELITVVNQLVKILWITERLLCCDIVGYIDLITIEDLNN